MGSYLSEPITEKVSMEELNDLLLCGASSMQGWRVSQEDAHNCILDFDEKTSYFAVYDGHGGHEVAKYCSQKLPDFLKTLEAYKNGDIKKALEDAFLGFDATIATPEVVRLLKELVGEGGENADSDEDEEEVNHLYEEANMPIEQVIEKYTNNLLTPRIGSLKEEGKPCSPFLKAKSSSSGSSSGQSSKVSSSQSQIDSISSSSTDVKETQENGHVKIEEIDSSNEVKLDSSEVKPKVENTEVKVESSELKPDSVKKEEKPDMKEEKPDIKEETPDGIKEEKKEPNNGETPNSTTNGSRVKKGKALAKTKGVTPATETIEPPKTRPKRNVQQMYAQLLDSPTVEELEEEQESDDDDFEDNVEDDDDDDDDEAHSPMFSSSSEEDSEDEEEEVAENDDDAAAFAFAKNMVEEPGSDSGCTAVVALLKDDKLYVANAGDSRCIVCRDGKAIEMSIDHKPEDQIEMSRIYKAGGRVTADGRVNGGLNLSRAIGDHAYKQNKELSDREQMITALPDVKTLDIDKNTDEFMVLACDGIWNFMSSQEVVDFVRPAIKKGTKLSKICEEMFDHCLAPNTMGDGTGCDNMTAIIVQFRSACNNLKRQASPEPEDSEIAKRPKTETEESALTSSTA